MAEQVIWGCVEANIKCRNYSCRTSIAPFSSRPMLIRSVRRCLVYFDLWMKLRNPDLACTQGCIAQNQECIVNCGGDVTCISQCGRAEQQCISGKILLNTIGWFFKPMRRSNLLEKSVRYQIWTNYLECPCPANNSVLLLSTLRSNTKPMVIRSTGEKSHDSWPMN